MPLQPMYCASIFVAATLASNLNIRAEAYLSPQAVFDAAQQHYRRQEYGAVVNRMTPDSLELWAGVALINAFAFEKELKEQGDENRAAREAIDALLISHGVPKERLANFAWKSFFAFTEKQKTKLCDELVQGIHHKPLFFHTVMAELAKHDEEQGKLEQLPYQFLECRLSDVQIDQDQAVGRITETKGDKPAAKSIRFRRTDQGWLIYVRYLPEK